MGQTSLLPFRPNVNVTDSAVNQGTFKFIFINHWILYTVDAPRFLISGSAQRDINFVMNLNGGNELQLRWNSFPLIVIINLIWDNKINVKSKCAPFYHFSDVLTLIFCADECRFHSFHSLLQCSIKETKGSLGTSF